MNKDSSICKKTELKQEKQMHAETIIAHFAEDRTKYQGAVVPPIFQNSLFTFESTQAIDDAFTNFNDSFIYARGNNPTVRILEEKLAALEGGEKAKLFTSGMAAISTGLLHFLNTGDHVICINSAYGPTQRFIQDYLAPKFNVAYSFVSGSIESIKSAIQENTRVIYLESPSSGVFAIQDLGAVATLAKSKGIKTLIDNTWATPIYQNPISLGIDVVIHSVSKYISGHSDVVAGVIISTKEIINSIHEKEYSLIGGKVAPFEAWLILRGLRTLPIRMRQHSENTKKILAYLTENSKVEKIHYPGCTNSPDYELARKQMSGFSGLLSFVVKTDYTGILEFINKLKLFKIGVSWGGFESLVYAPIISLSKEMSKESLKASGIHPGLIRISVGLENAEDLINDLRDAFEHIQ